MQQFFRISFIFYFLFTCVNLSAAEKINLSHDSYEREAFIIKPESVKSGELLPVLMVFHGGGGTAEGTMKQSKFPSLASEQGFIAVFPNGIKKSWNDLRPGEFSESHKKKYDDIGFVNRLIDRLVKDHHADPKRIYVTGISNGGIFSLILALKLGHKLAGAASICAQMPEGINESGRKLSPVSVMLMNGTKDPLVPYDGGDVVVNLMPGLNKLLGRKPKARGRVTSTQESIDFWLNVNGITTEPVVTAFEDKIKDDGVKATKKLWQQGDLAVCLITLDGGGHTMPGGKQYLPERLIGKVARDIDGEKEIWDFLKNFSNHSVSETIEATK